MNRSEQDISKINSNVFFEEFTFDKNDFYPKDGKKELADNVLWLDELLIVIQIKERNININTSTAEESKWFQNTVLKKAKRQIKKTIQFLTDYDEILIENRKNQKLDIAKNTIEKLKKIIVYKNDNELLRESCRLQKFCNSDAIGYIHLFESSDYYWICKILITPTEFKEYLDFRERMFEMYSETLNKTSEQYILAHFINTDDESKVNEKYINSLSKIKNNIEEFDLSHMIGSFRDKVINEKSNESIEYHQILRELAKLKRYELLEFKKRYIQIIEDSKQNDVMLPHRFITQHTGCGFVLCPVPKSHSEMAINFLRNITETFKYKWKLKKCLGVVAMRTVDNHVDLVWAYFDYEFSEDKELEEIVMREKKYIGKPMEKPILRYEFEE